MNANIMRALGLGDYVDKFEKGVCVFCSSEKTKPEDFRDELSRKDYGITGLCQACQDKTYKHAK